MDAPVTGGRAQSQCTPAWSGGVHPVRRQTCRRCRPPSPLTDPTCCYSHGLTVLNETSQPNLGRSLRLKSGSMSEDVDVTAVQPPRTDSLVFVCPHCGVRARHSRTEVMRVPKVGGVVPVEATWRQPFGTTAWFATLCPNCKGQSVWRGDYMVFPQRRIGPPPHPAMPEDVREIYDEAAFTAAVSRRAGAALARAAIERLIKTVDFTAPAHANLASRIERIRPEVSVSVAQMLDVVRHIGNKMLHGENTPDDLVVLALDDVEGPAVLEQLLVATNDLVEQLIVKRARAAALWEKLPNSVKTGGPPKHETRRATDESGDT